MQYSKTIADDFSDDVAVTATDGGYVYTDTVFRDEECQMAYTPAQARRLARALKRAANVAEGKPAKAKKPALPSVIVDGDGDWWYRGDDNSYTVGNALDDGWRSTAYAAHTRDEIQGLYLIKEERP